ncbi:MAG TPA: hypothetical protein PK487_03365 [bacterium]|nr:hypothetical protein [bacterium]
MVDEYRCRKLQVDLAMGMRRVKVIDRGGTTEFPKDYLQKREEVMTKEELILKPIEEPSIVDEGKEGVKL